MVSKESVQVKESTSDKLESQDYRKYDSQDRRVKLEIMGKAAAHSTYHPV